MRVAVLDDYAGAFARLPAAQQLAGHEVVTFADSVTGDALVDRLDGFDAVILLQQRTAVPREVVERLRTVRLLSQTGRNTSHLDVAACAARGITVSAGGAGGPQATAELTWALILAAVRHLPEEVQRLREGQWQSSVGTGLHAKTLGVYGLGRIGSLVAQVGRAFGMRVVVWGREGSLDRRRPGRVCRGVQSRSLLRRERRAERAPAAQCPDDGDRDGRGPGAHEARSLVRQHVASRDRRPGSPRHRAAGRSSGTRCRRRLRDRAGARTPPTRCSRCRTSRRPRTWDMSSGTCSSGCMRPRPTRSSPSRQALPPTSSQPEPVSRGCADRRLDHGAALVAAGSLRPADRATPRVQHRARRPGTE